MTFTKYDEYVRQLRCLLQDQRDDPSAETRIQVALCRNGYAYKWLETIGSERSTTSWVRAVTSNVWVQEDGSETRSEMERFFALPYIFAYSDRALDRRHNPVLTAHWAATIALIEVGVTRGDETWTQRMIFAGFREFRHAEFSLAMDGEILVHNHDTGSRLHEWRRIEHQH